MPKMPELPSPIRQIKDWAEVAFIVGTAMTAAVLGVTQLLKGEPIGWIIAFIVGVSLVISALGHLLVWPLLAHLGQVLGIAKPSVVAEAQTQPIMQPLALEYQRLADADLGHMDTRVIVYAVMHSAAIRAQDKPFIEFTFTLFNGCIFPVRVDTKAEGRIKGNGVPLDIPPDVLNTAGYDDPVQHGHAHILKMRQYLSDQEANRLASARKEGWETVPFDFTGLTIWTYPEGANSGKRKRLALYSPVLIAQRELFL